METYNRQNKPKNKVKEEAKTRVKSKAPYINLQNQKRIISSSNNVDDSEWSPEMNGIISSEAKKEFEAKVHYYFGDNGSKNIHKRLPLFEEICYSKDDD